RDAAFLHEGLEFLFRLSKDNALAEEDKGFFCFVDEAGCFCDRFCTDDRFWAVAADMFALFISYVIEFLDLGVLCDIDEYGSGAAAAGDIKGLGQDGWDLG